MHICNFYLSLVIENLDDAYRSVCFARFVILAFTPQMPDDKITPVKVKAIVCYYNTNKTHITNNYEYYYKFGVSAPIFHTGMYTYYIPVEQCNEWLSKIPKLYY